MPVLAVAAWLAALAGGVVPAGAQPRGLVSLGVVAVLAGTLAWRAARASGRRHLLTTWAAVVLVVGAVLCSTLVRRHAVEHNPVADLARQGAAVDLTAEVTDDPRTVQGQFEQEVLVHLDVRQVVGRGVRYRLRAPVLVIGHDDWSSVELGDTVEVVGRLTVPDGGDEGDPVSALMIGGGEPHVVAGPGRAWRTAGALRAAIRRTVRGRPPDQRALVPGLVDGDDAGLDPRLVQDFRTTGLTHVTAVSGTNLTLVVGFLVVVARWSRVRGRGLQVVAALGIVGFVLVARAQPSVVRAAAMGALGLLALGHDGRRRALRGLSVAVVALMLVDPPLADSPGFALSALATGGIVVLGPGWRDALARWLPLPVAEAVAVPTAAQLACTPVIAALSGQVSLVSVVTNLLAGPAVGPATVLGLVGGLVELVCDPLGRLLGALAGWCVAWIALVARRGAALPGAALPWGGGAGGLVVLTGLTVLVAAIGPRLARRPVTAVPAAVLLVAVLVVPRH